MEGLYTAISDEFTIFKKHSILTRIGISLIPFLAGLPTISYAGIYVVQWLDTFAISPSVLLVVFTEIITVCWIFGLEKFSDHISEMNDKKPFIIWRLSWKFLCPIVLFTIVVLNVIFFEGLNYGNYSFPSWSIYLGYSLNVLALMPIPLHIIYYFFKKKHVK
jgi:SNF family Na+-dependent transporter